LAARVRPGRLSPALCNNQVSSSSVELNLSRIAVNISYFANQLRPFLMFTSCILSESGYESPIRCFSPGSIHDSEASVVAGPSHHQFDITRTSTPVKRYASRSLHFERNTCQQARGRRTKDVAVQTIPINLESTKAIARQLKEMADSFDKEFFSQPRRSLEPIICALLTLIMAAFE
ncbi:hypothetical protein Tcan_00239, partial [Toxocara canis]